MSTKNTLTVTFFEPSICDPDSVYGKDVTPEQRIKSLTDVFVGALKSYGVTEAQIDTSVAGCVVIKNPSQTAIEVAKYMPFTKIDPLHPTV